MSVRRGLAWMSLAQAGFFVLQFICSVLLAHILSPYEMGVYAVAASIVGVLGALQAFGLSSLIVRERDLTPSLVANAFTANILTALFLSVCITVMSEVGYKAIGDAGIRSCMVVIALQPLIAIVEFVPGALLERHGRFQSIALVSLFKTFTVSVTTVALAYGGLSYLSMAIGAVAGSAVSALGMTIAGRPYVSFRLSLSEWRRVARYGGQMVAIAGVTALATRISEFILARLLGLTAMGFYGRATQLNALIWENIHLVIVRVIFIDLSDVRRRGLSLRGTYLRTLESMTVLLWPAFAGFAVLGAPLIATVYGNRWVPAALPMSLMCVASIIAVSIAMTWEVFVVCEETGRQAKFEVWRAGGTVLIMSAGSMISLPAAAAGRIADALVSVAIYRPHLERMTDTTLADFVPIYRRSFLLTLVAIGPAVALMTAYSWTAQAPMTLVVASIVAGVALWLAALRVMHHPVLVDIMRLAGRGRVSLPASSD